MDTWLTRYHFLHDAPNDTIQMLPLSGEAAKGKGAYSINGWYGKTNVNHMLALGRSYWLKQVHFKQFISSSSNKAKLCCNSAKTLWKITWDGLSIPDFLRSRSAKKPFYPTTHQISEKVFFPSVLFPQVRHTCHSTNPHTQTICINRHTASDSGGHTRPSWLAAIGYFILHRFF